MNPLLTLLVPVVVNTSVQKAYEQPIKQAAKVQQDIETAKRLEAERIAREKAAEEARKALEQALVAEQYNAPTQPQTPIRHAANGSNLYTPGQCTWYVKNRRPDLPNNLGNADTWVARAAAQGYATGYVPRVGAVGQRGMHVVYVEAVYGDGTILISEMNYDYVPYHQRSVVKNGSDYGYIY